MGDQTDLALHLAELHDPPAEEQTAVGKCAQREVIASGFCPDCETNTNFCVPRYPTANILTVSTSEIRTSQKCGRLYQWEYVRGRRPAYQAHEQAWGAALHRGLEALFNVLRDAQENGQPIDWSLTMGEMVDAALTPGVDSEGRPYLPPADPYARAAPRAVLRAYVEYWWTDATTYQIEAVELPFRLPVKTGRGRLVKGRLCETCGGGGGVGPNEKDCPECLGVGRLRPHREGRIDLVVKERESGRILVVEHKSTSWNPQDDRYYSGLEVDLQTALYFDAAREMGLNPAGVLYDVIRRPEYEAPKPAPALKKDGKPRAQKAEVQYSNPRHGERAEDYEERVYQLATSPETREQWFARRELEISEEQIRRAREIVHEQVDLIRWREKTGHYAQQGDKYTCARPGAVCGWLDVCAGRVPCEGDDFEKLYPLKRQKEGSQ